MVKSDAIPVQMNRPISSRPAEVFEVSAWYSLHGTVRVRASPVVDSIIAKIRAHCDRDFTVNLAPVDSESSEFSIEGSGEFAAGGVLLLDELITSLGPHATQPSVLRGVYEDEPCELVVAATEPEARMARSHYRLEQIKPLLSELVAEDRMQLVSLLADSGG
jgi:hypothetical protein